jgi:NAD(P)-dependent dehydrogenase (short-subunit alcohol dehydrogenase family)
MMASGLFDLTGKVAVVTGGTGAIGQGMCLGLAAAGASVVVIARDQTKITQTVDEIHQAGGSASGISADALDKSALEAAAKQILSEYGRIDILVNGAGGNKPEATAIPGQRSFFDLPPDALEWVFNLNFTSAVLASQVFGAALIAQNSGVIVNISSMASLKIMTRVVAYSAAKAAINNFTQWLAVYMAREHSPNIRVNAIAPGFFMGEQNRFLLTDINTGELTPRGKSIIQATPMSRFGDPEDLVGTLVWLCADASRFVTGIVVPVDGGFSAFSGI